jgi:hypothetical protein
MKKAGKFPGFTYPATALNHPSKSLEKTHSQTPEQPKKKKNQIKSNIAHTIKFPNN